MSTYRQYLEFELTMTLLGVEVTALRDPRMYRDNQSDDPKGQETTGSPEGDQRRWLREHGGADAEAPMEVKVIDVTNGVGPQSGWLPIADVATFINSARAAKPVAVA